METTVDDDEDQAPLRKPGAKPNSVPFTVPENRLLSELYLTNKMQYHAKSRVIVGEKNGETSQERFASQFAAELTKLGFALRTSAQVKQRIADIRKLGHKLIIKEREKNIDCKKRKKVFVEPWLRNVMDSLAEELHDGQDTLGRAHKRSQHRHEVDNMSVMAQNLLDNHRENMEKEKTRGKKKKGQKTIESQIERSPSSCAQSTRDLSSPSISEAAIETSFESALDDFSAETPHAPIVHKHISQEEANRSLTCTEIKQKLLEAQLRVALKTERLLDLKIKKMEIELALTTNTQQNGLFVMNNYDVSSGEEDGQSDEGWPAVTQDGLAGATADVESGYLLENLLNSIKSDEN